MAHKPLQKKKKKKMTANSQNVRFSECDVFTNCCRQSSCGPAVACRSGRVWVVVTHLRYQQMDEGRHHCQNISIKPPCAECQSSASALTSPQTPVDSTPTCPSITQATSCLGNLKSLAPAKTNFYFTLHFHSSSCPIHSFSNLMPHLFLWPAWCLNIWSTV